MKAYFRFIISHRLLVVLVVAGITALAGWSASRGVVASSLAKLFFGESPAFSRYQDRIREYGTEEVNVFAFRSPELLGKEQQASLRQAVDEIQDFSIVARVISLFDAQQIHVDHEETLKINRFAREALDNPARRKELAEALRKDRLVGGTVVSKDGKSTAIFVEVNPEKQKGFSAERGPVFVSKVADILARAGVEGPIHKAGFLVSLSATIEESYYNLRTIFPFVVVILLVTVWLLFRRLWPALLSGFVSLLAVIWTMGLAVAIDPEINIIMTMVPGVIMIVGFSDVVHLCSAYLLELEGARSKDEAILRSAQDVGRACFFTSITTFVGFICMSLIPTPVFRTAGVVFGAGVASALLIAMTITPIVFSLLGKPKPLRVGATSRIHEVIDRLLDRTNWLATRRTRWVLAAFALCGVLIAVGISQLNIQADFSSRFPRDHQLNKDLRWFKSNFAGATGLDMFIEVPDRDGLFNPETFASIARYQDQLVALPEVDLAFSFIDLIRDMHQKLDPGGGPLPRTRQAIAQYVLLFEMNGGEDLDRLIDFERRQMRITLRLNDGELRTSAVVGKRAQRMGPKLGQGATIEPSGLTYLIGDWIDEILNGQRRGLAVSILLITIMMIFALGGLRMALWSMVPNIFPLLALGGVMGGLMDYVDSDTLMVGLIAIGIGVDDTIHFLVRYRIEAARAPDGAIQRTFNFAGRAIMMTTVILVLGFLPFGFGDYFSTAMFGTLLPFCLVAALLADLLLVPALIKAGAIKAS